MTMSLNRELPVIPVMKPFTIKVPKRLVHLLLFTHGDEQACEDELKLSPWKRTSILQQHSDYQQPHHHQDMDHRPVSDLKSPCSSSPTCSEHDTPKATCRARKRIRLHEPQQEDDMDVGNSSVASGPPKISVDPHDDDLDSSPVIQRRKRFGQRLKRRRQRLKQQSIASMFPMQTRKLKAD
jgi:hypothetical protein